MQKHIKNIIFDYDKITKLCLMPYAGHGKGCPNFNLKKTCPPKSPKLNDVFVMNKGFWIVWNEFNISAHVIKMKNKHPLWSDRQLNCCLYWQTTARK